MKTLTSVFLVVVALAVMVQTRVAQSPVAGFLQAKVYELPSMMLKVVDRDGFLAGAIRLLWQVVAADSTRMLGPTAVPR
jgi:hypothetical protein